MSEQLTRMSNIGLIPVVKVTDLDDAVPMAKALCDGGIDVAEITYRSEFATQAIAMISKEVPEMLVGAGTVSTVDMAKAAVEAGATFIITPGFNEPVVKWCVENNVEVYPGVSSPSDIERALGYGLTTLKFFPAEASGGVKMLKAFSGPYANIKFIPTGGINASNMHDYLALPNVEAVGGSFMLPSDLIAAKDFDGIKELSRLAIKKLLDFQLIHLGINTNSSEESEEVTKKLCELFNFTFYKKPHSNFAGVGFEVLHKHGYGENGHIGIYTPYPERAIYHLGKKGIKVIDSTVTRNKKSHKVNFAFLDYEIAGFGIHLINPDLKMEI